jgi:hypothetical protein
MAFNIKRAASETTYNKRLCFKELGYARND